jgi:hypothetical protein
MKKIFKDSKGNLTLKSGEFILGKYFIEENKTVDGTGKNIGNGNCLDLIMGFGRFYVYVLLDPRNNSPFYVGKGTSNRIVEHFRVGYSPEEIFDPKIKSKDETDKNRFIQELTELDYGTNHIARVVGRRLSEETAFAIEGLLIKSIYGLDTLKNIVDGRHTDRFRPKDDWDYIKNFDLDTDPQGNFLKGKDDEYYVYVLRNPDTGNIFYVGKGKGNRLSDHFQDARIHKNNSVAERLAEISTLIQAGKLPKDIGRIVARVENESVAFMIESFYIKFVIGFNNIHNVIAVNASYMFRSFNDWDLRIGFDIPIIVESGQARTEELDICFAEGLDFELQKVVDKLEEIEPKLKLEFSNPRFVDAGELAVWASIPDINQNVVVRIQIRFARRFQIQLYPLNVGGRIWIENHFTMLNAYPLMRKDNRFIPLSWRGANNVTRDPAVAASRVLQIIKLARIARREDLSPDLELLLEGLPF